MRAKKEKDLHPRKQVLWVCLGEFSEDTGRVSRWKAIGTTRLSLARLSSPD